LAADVANQLVKRLDFLRMPGVLKGKRKYWRLGARDRNGPVWQAFGIGNNFCQFF
jgi:hypothetical protein